MKCNYPAGFVINYQPAILKIITRQIIHTSLFWQIIMIIPPLIYQLIQQPENYITIIANNKDNEAFHNEIQ